MDDEDVVTADLVTDLADRLQEGQRLDVADRAADLGDDDVDLVGRHAADAVLDLVGDVRDDLHGVAEVLAAPLLGDHRRVDLAGGDIGGAVQVAVEEALVVSDVQVGLGAVVGDEHLTVLEGVHRARVDVQVRVELLHHDAQAPRLEQHAEAGGGEALAERGGDTPGDEDVLGRRGCAVSESSGRHGQEGAPVVAVWGAVRLPTGDFRCCRRCGSGVSCPPVHGLPGYQRPDEMASGHAPHTSHTRTCTGTPVSHPLLTRSAHPRCPERHADHLRASYPARTLAAEPGRQHGTTPARTPRNNESSSVR